MKDLKSEAKNRYLGVRSSGTRPREATVAGVMCGVRALYGAVQLIGPTPVLDRRDSPAVHRLVRVLGARHLAQAAVTAPRPTPAVLAVGAQVDLLHAGTMLVAAAASSERRARPLFDAGVATLLGILGFVACSSAGDGRGDDLPLHGVPARLLDLRDRTALLIRRSQRRMLSGEHSG